MHGPSSAFPRLPLALLGMLLGMLFPAPVLEAVPIPPGGAQAGATHTFQPVSDVQQYPDPQTRAVLAKLAVLDVLHPQTVEDLRRAFPVYASLAGPPEKVFSVEDQTIPGPAGDLPARLYTPRAAHGLPIFVFFHGGGFVAGSLNDYDVPLRAIANRCDCLVVSVAYRLAPKHHFPAALDDAYAATQWVAAHAAEIGGDSLRIAVGGDGAGGNLAAGVTLKARESGGPALVLQVLICPVLDATMLTRSRITSKDPVFSTDTMLAVTAAYVSLETDLTNPYLSPIFAKNFRQLPPAFVITDQDDPQRDEAGQYAQKLKEAGVPVEVVNYPGVFHGFFLMPGALDAARKAVHQTGRALDHAFRKVN